MDNSSLPESRTVNWPSRDCLSFAGPTYVVNRAICSGCGCRINEDVRCSVISPYRELRSAGAGLDKLRSLDVNADSVKGPGCRTIHDCSKTFIVVSQIKSKAQPSAALRIGNERDV